MKEYLKDLLNKSSQIVMMITIMLALLIHLGGNELVVNKNLFQFGKKLVTYDYGEEVL